MVERKRLRVLALDGGGMRGVFTASVLARFEKALGRRIADHFDLIVGTSTGGILAIGLGLGVSAQDLLKFYKEKGRTIFPRMRLAGLKHAIAPKYKADGLRDCLAEILGSKKLGQSTVRLVIPTFDAEKGEACTFKTAHHERLRWEYDLPAVEVALATTAAPTFFPAFRIPTREDAAYFDGGVWANCPVIAGITEAVHFLGRPLGEIDMLSIGTASELPFFSHHADDGVLGWNKDLIDVLMSGQATAALRQAALLLGDRFVRIDLPSPGTSYALDDADPRTVQKLAAWGAGVSRGAHFARVETMFLNGTKTDPFVPVYK